MATARVQIRDDSLWISHVEGNDALRNQLAAVPPQARVTLRVGGRPQVFVKMRKGAQGLVPVDGRRGVWGELYRERPGAVVEIEAVDDPPPTNPVDAAAFAVSQWIPGTQRERDAAWAAFKALTRAGWRSEKLDADADRDDLHQR
jgi:hypothetical protein